MELDNIFEAIPGFELIDHTPGYTTLKVPSGFTLKVGRLPPFMFDLLERDDIKDTGPMIIKVKLLSINKPEANLTQDWPYEPPTDDEGNILKLDRDESPQAWVYYQQWRLHEKDRQDRAQLRSQERWNLLMVNSVEILDGPIDIDEDSWLEPLLYLISDPKSVGERKLVFFKTKVITGKSTKDVINKLAFVEEVTVEGLKLAFDSFLRNFSRQASK